MWLVDSMYVESLNINNYRNYDELFIMFDKNTNILYGDNAQGKTNILESIYMAATTKSHRGSKDREIIKIGEEESHIRLCIKKSDISHRIDMHLRKSKNKGVAIDGLPIRRTTELFGLLNVIFFSPEDLSIIKNGPSERRRFLDLELCQLSRLYYQNLSSYSKILNQRNNLLKQIAYNKSLMDTLDVWNMQLVDYGRKVIKERQNFINMINGSDARRFGSQGQQRTVALSLKIAEIKLVKNIINDNPILLLDDVMSELDSSRREALLEEIKDIQTIITCTGYDDFIKEQVVINNVYHVINGTVTKI